MGPGSTRDHIPETFIWTAILVLPSSCCSLPREVGGLAGLVSLCRPCPPVGPPHETGPKQEEAALQAPLVVRDGQRVLGGLGGGHLFYPLRSGG